MPQPYYNTPELFDNIPPELRDTPNWVVWKLEEKIVKGEKKLTKVPYQANGSKASTTNTATWGTFAQAAAALATGRYTGIGFVFTNSPYTGIDLDHCVENGIIEPWALDIVNRFSSYTEITPSGTGLHIIVKGTIPAAYKHNNVEMYTTGRYFTVTANHLGATPKRAEERQTELDAMYSELRPPKPEPAPAAPRQPITATETDVLDRAMKANDPLFRELWAGNMSKYENDHSSADMALMCKLAFYSQGDRAMMERLFSQSVLGQREKWTDRAYYRERTINVALETVTEYYQPQRNRYVTPRDTEAPGNNEDAVFDRTDTGNAIRMWEMYHDTVKYVAETNCFITYNGRFWEYDYTGNRVKKLSKAVARSFYQDAQHAADDKEEKAWADHARKSSEQSKRDAMLKLYPAEPDVEISVKDLDTDIYFLNCANGTVDLRTGKLKPHDKRDLITKFIPLEYNPAAFSELWDAFLQSTFANNYEDMTEYIHRAVGMSATGDMSNMAVFLPSGHGWNGKSTLLRAIRDTLGDDYSAQVDPSVFMARDKSSGPNEGIASLYKKRFVCATETTGNTRLNSELLKRMTGGETLVHEKKYQHAFEFQPIFKLWLSGNERPHVTDATDSIWLRLKQIPFMANFRPETPGYDPDLKEMLSQPENLQGILTWIVDGAVKWYQGGKVLPEPEVISNATRKYRQDEDVLHDFEAEHLERNAEFNTLATELWTTYQAYCARTSDYKLTKTTLYERMRQRGYEDYTGHGNKKYFKGVKLVN